MENDKLPCVQVFGLVVGAEVQDFVERTTGQPCPCRQGRQCPLVATIGGPAAVEVSQGV